MFTDQTSYPGNYYHMLQDMLLPAFMKFPLAERVRIFSPQREASPSGQFLHGDFLEHGIETLPLLLEEHNDDQEGCVFVEKIAPYLAPYREGHWKWNFAFPVLPGDARQPMPLDFVHGLSQRLAGREYRIPRDPKPLYSGEDRRGLRPVKVRIMQRTKGTGRGNIRNLRQVLEWASHRLEERAPDLPTLEISILNMEDYTGTKKELFDVMADTDVLLGAHGAGMTNIMFMHPCSSVTQIQPGYHCIFYGSEVFEGLARTKNLLHTHYCVTLDRSIMAEDSQHTQEMRDKAEQMFREGGYPYQQEDLYRLSEIALEGAELEQLIRQGVRHNLVCRQAAFESLPAMHDP